MRRILLIILIVIFSLQVVALPPSEYQIKSALIFNFLRFVELRGDRVINNEIILCSFDKNPLNSEVRHLHNKSLGEKKILFSEIYSENEIDKCSVLIVDKKDKESLVRIIDKSYKLGILLISDNDGYGEMGVVINMYIEDEKVKFEINLEAANKSEIKISSRLLSIARIVKNPKK